MQRIHEEYGAIFEHLYRQHQKISKVEVDLSPGDLFHYGGVEWLNIADFLGKIKKGLELHATCFVFKTAVVFLCKVTTLLFYSYTLNLSLTNLAFFLFFQERLRHKKKLMVNYAKRPGLGSFPFIYITLLYWFGEKLFSPVWQCGEFSWEGTFPLTPWRIHSLLSSFSFQLSLPSPAFSLPRPRLLWLNHYFCGLCTLSLSFFLFCLEQQMKRK